MFFVGNESFSAQKKLYAQINIIHLISDSYIFLIKDIFKKEQQFRKHLIRASGCVMHQIKRHEEK